MGAGMVIWKFKLKSTDRHEIVMPVGAQILSAQMQNGVCSIWALCDLEMPNETRKFVLYGSGSKLPSDPGVYIATLQFNILEFHLFEIERKQFNTLVCMG